MKTVALSFALLFTFLSNSYGKEFIVEIKKGMQPSQKLKALSVRDFKVLGKSYHIVEMDELQINFLDQFKEVSLVEENHETFTFDQTYFHANQADFKKQWGLKNEGKNEPVSTRQMSPLQGVVGADINILKAWDLHKGSKDVIVAIIDTGVKWDHIELKNNMWINEKELNGKKNVDDDGNGFVDDIHGYDFVKNDGDPMDEHGHGTHCAGIVGASHREGTIAGVMENVSMMAVRMMDHRGRGKLEQSIKAVGYAIENGAHVLSNSWGSRGYSEILENLLRDANQRGIVVVAAAGNSRFNDNDENPTYPATYNSPNIISVSAYNAQERHSAFSSFGKKTVHVAAPGTNILSSFIKKRRNKEIYKVASGTSMSAPHVSGMVGLFLSLNGHQYSPEEIKNHLIETSVEAKEIVGKNAADGRVDAFNFLSRKP